MLYSFQQNQFYSLWPSQRPPPALELKKNINIPVINFRSETRTETKFLSHRLSTIDKRF